MSENLIESVSPLLSPPVTRQSAAAATTSEDVDQSILSIGPVTISFAADDDE
jgi:hypothetical protein